MQTADYQDIKDIEAGLKDGYGILILLLVVGVGYLIYDQTKGEDSDNSTSNGDSGTTTNVPQ